MPTYTIAPICPDNYTMMNTNMCVLNSNITDPHKLTNKCPPKSKDIMLSDGKNKCNFNSDNDITPTCPDGSTLTKPGNSFNLPPNKCIVDLSSCKFPNHVNTTKKTCVTSISTQSGTPSGPIYDPITPTCPPNSNISVDSTGLYYFCT
jgi:hypothetical protein